MRARLAVTGLLAVALLVVSLLLVLREFGPRDIVSRRKVDFVFRTLPEVRHKGNVKDSGKHVLLFLDYADPRSLTAYRTVDSLLQPVAGPFGYAVVSLPKDRLFDHSSEAATFAECAAVQGRFFQGIEYLMLNTQQGIFTTPSQFATAVGLANENGFVKCLGSTLAAHGLIRDAALAESLSVGNSPVTIVNNRRYQKIPNTAWLARELGIK
jgi:hypothetical protein